MDVQMIDRRVAQDRVGLVISDSVGTHIEVTLWGESVMIVTHQGLLQRIGHYIDIMYVMPRHQLQPSRMVLHSTASTRIQPLSMISTRGMILTRQLARAPMLCSQVSVQFTQQSAAATQQSQLLQRAHKRIGHDKRINDASPHVTASDKTNKSASTSTSSSISIGVDSIESLLQQERSGRYRVRARVTDITFPQLSSRPLPVNSNSNNGHLGTSYRSLSQRPDHDWNTLVYRGCTRCHRPLMSSPLGDGDDDDSDDGEHKRVVDHQPEVLLCRHCPLLDNTKATTPSNDHIIHDHNDDCLHLPIYLS
jgi:hypothetical protein